MSERSQMRRDGKIKEGGSIKERRSIEEQALVGLAEETKLDKEFLIKTYDTMFCRLIPGNLSGVKKETILQTLKKLPVRKYLIGKRNLRIATDGGFLGFGDTGEKITSEDVLEILNEEILKELVNNHPEFEGFELLKNDGIYGAGHFHHPEKEEKYIEEYLLDSLSISRNELVDKIEIEKRRRRKNDEEDESPRYTYGAGARTLRHINKEKEEKPRNIDEIITKLIKERYTEQG